MSSPALTVCRFFDDGHSDPGFPGGARGKEPSCLCRRFETQVRFLGQKDPMEKEWQPTPVILPGESHGQKNLAGCRP